ncbi:MAG: AraC family transcriptional regulator [Candidatus Merdivicinus sp.]
MLLLDQAGYSYRHPMGFEVYRPNGSGNWLLLLLKSRTRVFLPNETVDTQPGAVILYPPGMIQHYRAIDSPWENDYIHFLGEEAAELSTRLQLPLGQIRYPVNIGEISRKISAIEEAAIRTPELADIIADAELRSLFLILHRMEELPSGRNVEPLRQLRLTLYRTLAEPWSIERMAETVHLSTSHFYAEYKKLFHISPTADLISMRIALAQYYLENTDLPLSGIIPLIGFTNECHFIRQFKQHTGQTPAAYRSVSKKH